MGSGLTNSQKSFGGRSDQSSSAASEADAGATDQISEIARQVTYARAGIGFSIKVYRLAEDGERFQEICIFDCFVCLENRALQGLNCALWLRGDATGYISFAHPYHAFGIALPRSCYR
jgi:hypothetical protein